jgi:hypothetical protein
VLDSAADLAVACAPVESSVPIFSIAGSLASVECIDAHALGRSDWHRQGVSETICGRFSISDEPTVCTCLGERDSGFDRAWRSCVLNLCQNDSGIQTKLDCLIATIRAGMADSDSRPR